MANSSSATKKILWGLGGLLIVVVILGVVGRVTGMFGGGSNAVSVETSDAAIRTITQVVTASGKIQPETDVMISPDVSGEVIQLTVREGDYVEKGILLARIKPDFYVTQEEQAQAGVLQARASQAQRRADMLSAQSELRRQEDLFERIIEVETGISDDAFVEIRSGLNGDEKIIIGPFQAVSRTLEPGDEVDAEEGGKAPPFVAARD